MGGVAGGAERRRRAGVRWVRRSGGLVEGGGTQGGAVVGAGAGAGAASGTGPAKDAIGRTASVRGGQGTAAGSDQGVAGPENESSASWLGKNSQIFQAAAGLSKERARNAEHTDRAIRLLTGRQG